jgi:hypothetical protein
MNIGMFTGRKFSNYFTLGPNGKVVKDDWVGAWAIINGNDKAELIASYARQLWSHKLHQDIEPTYIRFSRLHVARMRHRTWPKIEKTASNGRWSG